MLSALMAVEFPPFGAAAQSLVFMINFAATWTPAGASPFAAKHLKMKLRP